MQDSYGTRYADGTDHLRCRPDNKSFPIFKRMILIRLQAGRTHHLAGGRRQNLHQSWMHSHRGSGHKPAWRHLFPGLLE